MSDFSLLSLLLGFFAGWSCYWIFMIGIPDWFRRGNEEVTVIKPNGRRQHLATGPLDHLFREIADPTNVFWRCVQLSIIAVAAYIIYARVTGRL